METEIATSRNWKASGSHGFKVSDRLKEPAVFTFVWDTGGKGAVRNLLSLSKYSTIPASEI